MLVCLLVCLYLSLSLLVNSCCAWPLTSDGSGLMLVRGGRPHTTPFLSTMLMWTLIPSRALILSSLKARSALCLHSMSGNSLSHFEALCVSPLSSIVIARAHLPGPNRRSASLPCLLQALQHLASAHCRQGLGRLVVFFDTLRGQEHAKAMTKMVRHLRQLSGGT